MAPRKVVITGSKARDIVLDGARFLRDAVVHTLGPYGTNGLLENGLRITNDGVSIAAQVQSDDEIEDLGIRKVREAATKANDQGGDGSTTTVLLTVAIAEEGAARLGGGTTIGKISTASLIRQIEDEKNEVIEKLRGKVKSIESLEELIHSAVVSVEDEELGKMIAEVQWDLGPDGVIIPEQTAETRTYIEKVPGITIDNGLGMTQVINNVQKQMLELTDVPVLMTTNTLTSLQPILHIFNALAEKDQRHVVIICRAINELVIKQIQENEKNGFFIYPINAPYVNQREVMKDLEAVLGGRFVDADEGDVESIQYSDLGHASRVATKRYDGVIAGKESEETTARIAARVARLEEELAGAVSDFEKKSLAARLAQLKSGFAIAKVGSVSETERKRVFDKVEDAVNATRAALQEGTVPGAGLAFKEIAEALPDTYILKKPLMAVHAQITKNAPKDFVVEEWVRDPFKVMRIALEQACSVAGDLATINVAVATKRERARTMQVVDNEE